MRWSGRRVAVNFGIAIVMAMLLAITMSIRAEADTPALPPASPRSAITSTWAWGNSVSPKADNRGLGQPGMAPHIIAAFAHAHHLSLVYLATPWAANEGAVSRWLSQTVDALHAEGIKVDALGGDPTWLNDPSLVSEWIASARAAADFDGIELDIEPWVGVQQPDYTAIASSYLTLLGAVRAASGSLKLGIDLPWWLTTKDFGQGTVFDALLGQVDSVAIIAFSDHAKGTGGIVQLAKQAVSACVRAGKSFTIGVQTSAAAESGGAEFTFGDDGARSLETQSALVRTAFSSNPGYGGVSVQHLVSWEDLGD